LKTLPVIISLLLVSCFSVNAQIKRNNFAISFGINAPLGNFSSTHLPGISAEGSSSKYLFDTLRRKKVAFTYNSGVAYYFGKKETVSGYPYKYSGYTFIHAFAGIIINPVKRTSISLTTGPSLGIYNGNSQFNFGGKLEITYHLKSPFSISSGILMMKENKSDPLWGGSLKFGISF